MVAAWDVDADFAYRFVICLALLMRVGTTIDDEIRGHKLPTFTGWWDKAIADQPFFEHLRGVRNSELKVSVAGTAAHRFPRSGPMPRVARALRIRPRPRLTGTAQTVIQSEIVGDRVGHTTSRVIGPRIIRVSAHGAFAGYDALPIVSQYLDWLDQILVPGAEARAGFNASRAERPH